MTTLVAARAATGADGPEVARLQERLRSELVDQKGGAALLETLVPLDAGRTVTWIGVIGDVPVGLAVAGIVVPGHSIDLPGDSIDLPGDSIDLPGGSAARAVLETIYVEPEARAVGVGSSLMRAVRSWAIGRGAAAIDATVLPGDRASKNFFERHGLVARAITVRTPLR